MEPVLTDLTIEVNQRCPNRCLFCSSLATENSPHILSLEDILSLGKQAKALGLQNVSISGGEPLCHPNIVDVVQGLFLHGLHVNIYTTGLCFDGLGELISYKNWGDFRTANPTLIFNIQSSTPEIHDRIVGRNGAFPLTREAMLRAYEEGYRVEVHIVPNKINLDSLENTVHDLIDWGIERVSFLRIVYQGYARYNKDALFLEQDDLHTLKTIFKSLYEQYANKPFLRFGIPFSGMVEKPQHCNAGKSKLIIRYDGKVFPCEAFKDATNSSFILGDIRNDLLSNILHEGLRNTFLLSLKKQVCFEEPCPAQLLYESCIS